MGSHVADMEPTPEKVPTTPTPPTPPTSGPSNAGNPVVQIGPPASLERPGDTLWTRAFLLVFCGLSFLVAALFAYFYFQRPESLASAQLEDALFRAEHSRIALCLYQVKALQYNLRLLIALRFLGMFIGAQCILLGALFLLKGIETNYQFHLKSDRASSSINTSSPGLVLITLGVALVALTQFHDQELASGAAPSCEQTDSSAPPAPTRPHGSVPPEASAGPDAGAADLASAAHPDSGLPVAEPSRESNPEPATKVTPSHRRKTRHP